MTNAKKPTMAQSIMGTSFAPQAQLPSIQAGWQEFELLMKGRKWPDSIVEVCRQAYFTGADRLHQIITAMPEDANVVGRVHASIHHELREFYQDMSEMARIRAAAKASGDTTKDESDDHN